MPNITRQDISDKHIVLTIDLAKDDYLPTVNKKLKEYRKKANFKGFRPGKVPMNLVKRRFGNSILAEEINDLLNKQLKGYIDEHELEYIGQPLPVEDEEDINININNPQDYDFKYELGLVPDFTLAGFDDEHALDFYDVEVTDEELEPELDRLRSQYGEGFEEDVTDIDEGDFLKLKLEELDGEGNLKEDGFVKEESGLLVKDIADEELKKDVLTATIGDSFDVDIYALEDKGEEHVNKYVLGLEDDQEVNNQFRMTIEKIQRVKKAELNEDFFKKLFPQDTPEDVDAFKERIRDEIYKGRKSNSRQLFMGLLHDSLMELNELELPVAFLEKWIKATQGTEAKAGDDTYARVERAIRWSLIRDYLAKKYDVEVTYEDVRMQTQQEILRYFNYQIPPNSEMVTNLVDQVLKDQNEVQRRYEQLLDYAVLDRATEDAPKNMKQVTKEEFEKLVEEREEKLNADNEYEEDAIAEKEEIAEEE